jgi:hypothetical protein
MTWVRIIAPSLYNVGVEGFLESTEEEIKAEGFGRIRIDGDLFFYCVPEEFEIVNPESIDFPCVAFWSDRRVLTSGKTLQGNEETLLEIFLSSDTARPCWVPAAHVRHSNGSLTINKTAS